MQETRQRNSIKQELVFKNHMLRTSALPAECFVCGKGLSDGYSVTAKSLHGCTELFCSVHFQLQ